MKRNPSGPQPGRVSGARPSTPAQTGSENRVATPAAQFRSAGQPTKSLMKIADLAAKPNGPRRNGPGSAVAPAPASARRRNEPSRQVEAGRQQKIEERIVAASEELASGIHEAASAAEELRRAMEQIASGAEEAASASQESLAAVTAITSTLGKARDRAEAVRRRTETLQTLLAEAAAQIGLWAGNIKSNGERQAGSVAIIESLRQQAESIGEVTKTVSQISDQTNRLAHTAAIAAARAGDHGRGFAVVADEVRGLAETSDRSARDVQGLAERMRDEVQVVAAMINQAATAATTEAAKGQTIIGALGELRKEIAALAEGSQSIALSAVEAESAAREAQKGSEIVAAAAEEQAAAAAEALRGIEQQSVALTESQAATQSLAGLASDLRAAAKGTGSAAGVASAADELSAAVQEISGAATEIMAAVEQISRGAQQQAAATQESGAALTEIERTAGLTHANASGALERTETMVAILKECRRSIGELSAGVAISVDTTRKSLALIAGLDGISRSLDKIVEGIRVVSIQTTMLAVSGSVEAARAGEFGKGFAVVSNDIRSLARDSGDNAGRIQDTVQSIQDQIGVARRELELIVSAADAENSKNAGVVTSLAAVEADMGDIRSRNEEILVSAESIMAATKQAALGAEQVAAAAEEAGSAATQASMAAKQQAEGAELLAAAIEEIASLADDVQRRNG